MTDQTDDLDEVTTRVRAKLNPDGFRPRCGALDDQTCVTPAGNARPDHRARRPMPHENRPTLTPEPNRPETTL